MSVKYVIGGIPFRLRLMLYVLLAAGGVVFQTVTEGTGILGFLLVVGAASLMLARSYRNKPADLGYEEWKPVSYAEFQRIRTNLEQSKKNKVPLYYRPGLIAALIVPSAGLLFFSLFFSLPVVATVVINGFVLALPLVASGLIKLWIPRDLAMKTAVFYMAVAEDRDIVVTPYLRFDRDKEGREIPEDVRFMIELRRNPDDFVGIQLQVAINNGPNGAVPYMYAVYLCRGKGASYAKLADQSFGSYVTEAGGDDEYGTIVVRQQTSGTGYHTKPRDCLRLVGTVVEGMRNLAPG